MINTLLANANGATFWLPVQASTFAEVHDPLFYFIYWVCVVSFVVVVGVMAYFGVKYKRKQEGERTSGNRGNFALEVGWIAVPSVFLLIIFWWGFQGFVMYQTPPANTLNVRVTADTWSWSFRYPDGTVSSELIVPVDQPVRLTMTSESGSAQGAVIHSLFIPAFRLKRDVLPDRYTVLWFEATREGTYTLFCTEYCGTGHSEMNVPVHVVPSDEFAERLAALDSAPDGMTTAEWGQQLFAQQGCTACHSVDGSRLIGPTMQGLYGSTREFTDGSTRVADENYLRESILEPSALINVGYQNVMPSYAGRLTDGRLDAIIAYIESLAD
ncbi:MAG: cytochrome c oxidase subunit II [Deltaproteobacteria bacterium]|nr:MAG: cytochrome c oxidase subunit II [Deltaproteobacteria bacterium]